MEKYENIKIWGFLNRSKDPKNEYHRRFTNVTTIKTNLFINPILRGERQAASYELFVLPIEELLQLADQINQNSRQIERLANSLPDIAADQFFTSTLRTEIMSTNEIEGVHTTKAEVTEAINDAQTTKATRLKSFARLYLDIKRGVAPSIKTLPELRQLYDTLLSGEIAPDRLPDGQLFRDSPVRIGNHTTTVLLPKASEQALLPDLLAWLQFINGQVPAIFKAFIAHYFFEYVHPFNDGNGRLGRYIACVYLGAKLDPLSAITFSSEVNRHKQDYYKAFTAVTDPRNFGEITFFVLEMMRLLQNGQTQLLEDLTVQRQSFEYATDRINALSLTAVEKDCLHFYMQAHLFNSDGLGIEDRQLVTYLPTYSKSLVQRTIRHLDDLGWVVKTKKSPLTRQLTADFSDLVFNPDI